MNEITKTFPGVRALDKVSLRVRPGSVHALMGENGAGKSTLMKCAYGLYEPDSGEILISGQRARLSCAKDAIDQGISMIHQELHPVRTRNVMENLWMGNLPCKTIAGLHIVDSKKLYEQTVNLLAELEINLDPVEMTGNLSVAHIQLLEIARAVSLNSKIIIMDEPTSSLTETEAALLFKIIRKLTAQGTAIVYISHKIDEILEIADEVSIMRDGTLVGCWSASELTSDLIIKRMVGREMTNRFPERKRAPTDVYLEVRHLTSISAQSFKDVSFTLRRGEILGVGGLVGAQRTELMEAIFGLRSLASGEIILNGRPIRNTTPRAAIRNGFALLTEDRRATGIIAMLSLLENMLAANGTAHPRQYLKKLILLDSGKRRADTEKYVSALSIKTPSIKQQIQFLSGGNQQKVLLGRWLLTVPDILILDEPTRGIDVGAKYEIYTFMESIAAEGKCVIMISSEMPELLGMSDRILVMCEGRLSGILDRTEATEEKVMYYASAYQGEQI
ncbi:MAG: sugar ABC transporter ATP-binding protein [Spirochaetaceae bacterium]|jgi:methyl-galactoside transport system ATP-binding protein|nr:sugar ABC transporter ATP-binding protein [Spirochaetaceae bacterium]